MSNGCGPYASALCRSRPNRAIRLVKPTLLFSQPLDSADGLVLGGKHIPPLAVDVYPARAVPTAVDKRPAVQRPAQHAAPQVESVQSPLAQLLSVDTTATTGGAIDQMGVLAYSSK